MEHGDAQRIGILHFVNERLIPDRIECFLFNAGSIWFQEQREQIRFTAFSYNDDGDITHTQRLRNV